MGSDFIDTNIITNSAYQPISLLIPLPIPAEIAVSHSVLYWDRVWRFFSFFSQQLFKSTNTDALNCHTSVSPVTICCAVLMKFSTLLHSYHNFHKIKGNSLLTFDLTLLLSVRYDCYSISLLTVAADCLSLCLMLVFWKVCGAKWKASMKDL